MSRTRRGRRIPRFRAWARMIRTRCRRPLSDSTGADGPRLTAHVTNAGGQEQASPEMTGAIAARTSVQPPRTVYRLRRWGTGVLAESARPEAVLLARKGIHMSDQDVAVIRAAYEAFNRADIPAVLGAFDEQIEWTEPGGGKAHAGRSGDRRASPTTCSRPFRNSSPNFKRRPRGSSMPPRDGSSSRARFEVARRTVRPWTNLSPTCGRCATARPPASSSMSLPSPGRGPGEASDARVCGRRSIGRHGQAADATRLFGRPARRPNPSSTAPRMMSVNAIARGRNDGIPGRRTPSTAASTKAPIPSAALGASGQRIAVDPERSRSAPERRRGRPPAGRVARGGPRLGREGSGRLSLGEGPVSRARGASAHRGLASVRTLRAVILRSYESLRPRAAPTVISAGRVPLRDGSFRCAR